MHECTSIIINSFHLFQKTLFNKGFVVEGAGGSLKKEWKKQREEGVNPISILTLWKIVWFFKQQIEFLLISCLPVAKSFIQKV